MENDSYSTFVGATLGLVQATSTSSLSGNAQLSIAHLQPRDNKHHKHKHNKKHHNKRDIDEDVYPLYRKRGLDSVPVYFEKRSPRNDYDRAIKYMERARKSYERAQSQNGGSRRYRGTQSTNYLQNPDRFSRPRRQRPINNGPSSYYQSLDYTGDRDYTSGDRDYTSGDRDYTNNDREHTDRGYTGSGSGSRGIESPPLPPTGSPPPTPIPLGSTEGATSVEGEKGSSKEGGGEEGSASEIKEWGLTDGKIPAGADIEEEDAPDPEQDPSDAIDPPIINGKPVAREE